MKYLLWIVVVIAIPMITTKIKGKVSWIGIILAIVLGTFILKL